MLKMLIKNTLTSSSTKPIYIKHRIPTTYNIMSGLYFSIRSIAAARSLEIKHEEQINPPNEIFIYFIYLFTKKTYVTFQNHKQFVIISVHQQYSIKYINRVEIMCCLLINNHTTCLPC